MTNPDTQYCARCRFFSSPHGFQMGNCRRYPPQKVEYSYAQWPEVSKRDWCGEFQAKEEG